MKDTFLKDAHIAERYDVHRATVWDWLKDDPSFPKPFKLSARCTRWKKSEIDAWEAQKRAS